MERSNIILMQDFSEAVQYDQAGIPLYIRTDYLSAYPNMSAPCHWHDDIEWTHIQKGRMCYYVNGKRMVLNAGDSLMVNARQMHYGYSFHQEECLFTCIIFHPSLFASGRTLTEKYVTPLLSDPRLDYLFFAASTPEGQNIAGLLNEIIILKKEAPNAYELKVISLICSLWYTVLTQQKPVSPENTGNQNQDLKCQKDMITFIYQHYPEKITLNEIAAAGHISRSKCCQIFKHYTQQSPVDFLNTCRLKVSCRLLETTDLPVTDVALQCGYTHLSYFSKSFLAAFRCTPREYRSRMKKTDDAKKADRPADPAD